MYALIDGNSFYANCEKAYDPSIRNLPVVVLTNNDGCLCAACSQAKALGFGANFEPYFKIKRDLAQNGVIVRSSNYELYGDLSHRMMQTILRFAPNGFIYSIDECFLQFDENENQDYYLVGDAIRRAVAREVRLPVAVGFGETLTLAKAANHAAKRIQAYHKVAVINSDCIRRDILRKMPVAKVWGIGRKLSMRLESMGIKNAFALSQMPYRQAREMHNVTLEKTVRELNGQACLKWENPAPKKEVFSTRAFGQRITEKSDLRQALSFHATTVARKLRAQGSMARAMTVFATNSPYDNTAFSSFQVTVPFAVATDSEIHFINAIDQVLRERYIAGVNYYRCGVGLLDLSQRSEIQTDLLMPHNKRDEIVTKTIDTINSKFGKGRIGAAIIIGKKNQPYKWSMNQKMISKRATTRLSEIPVFNEQLPNQ